MTLDKKAIDKLMTLDDKRLSLVIQKLAADAGIDPSTLNICPSQLAGIRSALSMATDNDIQRAGELLKNYKIGKKGQ